MNKSALSFLTVLSIASLVVTFFLAQSTSKYDMNSSDAASFQAPHLQRNMSSSAAVSSSSMLEDGEVGTPRRNLSESGNSTSVGAETRKPVNMKYVSKGGSSSVSRTHLMQQEQQRQKEQEQEQKEESQKEEKQNKDNRPSGVVYNYIAPPPINMTARALLSRQFPRLADLDSASTSAAICGIVKDAEPYLDEWVDYHFGLGFHTIYLIDNTKDHELLKWQNRRRKAGYSVRVMPKPGTHRQMYGFHMCVAEHKDDHAFMGFFDVDEFLVLKKHDTVDEFLSQYLTEGSLSISWYIFGTGNRNMYAPLPVTKRFTLRDGPEAPHPQWKNVKCFLKLSDYGGYPQSPHSMKTKRGTWKDTNGAGKYDKIGSTNDDRPVDVAVLHHYKYLSTKEFYWKSCVRKTVDDKFKDCESLKKRGLDKPATSGPYVGRIYDDSAWQLLKKNVPRYAMFDEFEDFM